MNLTKTQAVTLEAIRNLPADAPYGKVEPGISYSGVKAYKGVNATAVHALIKLGRLVVVDGKVEPSDPA
jgi:hypothetical protein